MRHIKSTLATLNFYVFKGSEPSSHVMPLLVLLNNIYHYEQEPFLPRKTSCNITKKWYTIIAFWWGKCMDLLFWWVYIYRGRSWYTLIRSRIPCVDRTQKANYFIKHVINRKQLNFLLQYCDVTISHMQKPISYH